jgi:hypothetical protein
VPFYPFLKTIPYYRNKHLHFLKAVRIAAYTYTWDIQNNEDGDIQFTWEFAGRNFPLPPYLETGRRGKERPSVDHESPPV